MADEKKVKENGKQFAKKKTNRMSVTECHLELERLKKMNQTASKYYGEVAARLKEVNIVK